LRGKVRRKDGTQRQRSQQSVSSVARCTLYVACCTGGGGCDERCCAIGVAAVDDRHCRCAARHVADLSICARACVRVCVRARAIACVRGALATRPGRCCRSQQQGAAATRRRRGRAQQQRQAAFAPSRPPRPATLPATACCNGAGKATFSDDRPPSACSVKRRFEIAPKRRNGIAAKCRMPFRPIGCNTQRS